MKIMSMLAHANVCQYLGSSRRGHELLIVMELLPKGDLASLMHKEELSLHLRLKMACDAAHGLVWLHKNNPVILHRDLKTSNLLVDEHYRVKLCDFGLSGLKPVGKHLESGKIGTPVYSAPEIYLRQEEYSTKADVYSFGICLWEIATKVEPFPQIQTEQEFKIILQAGTRPDVTNISPPSLVRLMQDCWKPNPAERPDFDEIIQRLEAICVDCVVFDRWANEFWLTLFRGRDTVPWTEFWNSFAISAGVQTGATKQASCLRLILCGPNKNQVSIENWGRLLSSFGPGDTNLLRRVHDLCQEPYFHGEITTKEAVDKLVGLESGSFLVRFSQQPGFFAISLKEADGRITHYRVEMVGSRAVLDGNAYDSVRALVRAYATILHTPCKGSMFSSIFVDNASSMYAADKLSAGPSATLLSRPAEETPANTTPTPTPSKHLSLIHI